MSVDRLAPSGAAGWRRGQDVRPSSADLPRLSLQSSGIAHGRECSDGWQGGQRETVTGKIAAQCALVIRMACGPRRMFSGCSQFSVG
jgi:hypothetical protein